MNWYIFALLLCASLNVQAQSIKTDTLTFRYEGKRYSGWLSLPVDTPPAGLIIIVPGSGPTDMGGSGYYAALRQAFSRAGWATYVWDKAGCGKSEGIFEGDVSIQSSAKETIAAIEELKLRNIPGADKTGLWGLSRGGWVCPLVIASCPSIRFWISVSGPDDKENFAYLLERNWRAEGRSRKETKKLVNQWHSKLDIARHGGTFEESMEATEDLRKDSLYVFLTKNNPPPTKEGFLRWQQGFRTGENMPVDEKTGLQVYFPGFDTVLNKIGCPVLAIFGEKDSQVDWRKTIALYRRTVCKNSTATLTVRTFPDGNHIIYKCKTGGYREKLPRYEYCDGYVAAMLSWLKDNGPGG